MKKTALIFGVNGQDGSHLVDLLLEKGYIVHGVIRRASTFNTQRISHVLSRIQLHYGDITDATNVTGVIAKVKPHEIYNFAAMSHVKVSFDMPMYTFQTITLGTLNVLQAVISLGLMKTRVYHASTSEQYGNTTDGTVPLTEDSPMHPVSPYGIAKLAAYNLCNYYRDAYGLFVVSSILLNHEGPRRGGTFVTKKIADYARNWKSGTTPLRLGNIDAKRDWGHAQDYVQGIYLMMQAPRPSNYVLATGEAHSVREFVELAFSFRGITVKWTGHASKERGVDSKTGETLVVIDPKYYRPIDIQVLVGDASKARRELGWVSTTSFDSLVKCMVLDGE